MIFGYFILFISVIISAIAAWYSVVGLTAIFAAAVVPVMIMGGALEAGKIVATVWLHNNWKRVGIWFKLYLVPAIIFLMLLTSMGIFGFLSKAHSDQSLVSGDVQSKIAIYDEKIKTERENIDAARKALSQMDSQVNERLSRSTDDRGAERAVQIRRQQQAERTRLQNDISRSQGTIVKLNEERSPIAAEVRKVEAEVGPIKYIAALIYGDNPDANLLERAVSWVIVLIVVVFDPLALTLILAANKQLEWARAGKGGWVHDDAPPPLVVNNNHSHSTVEAKHANTDIQSPESAQQAAQDAESQRQLAESFVQAKLRDKILDEEHAAKNAEEANLLLAEIPDPAQDPDVLIDEIETTQRDQSQQDLVAIQQQSIIDTLCAEFETLSQQLQSGDARVQELQAELAQSQQLKTDLKSAYDATSHDNQDLKQHNNSLDQQLVELGHSMRKKQLELDAQNQQLDKLQGWVDQLQGDLQAAVQLATERNQLVTQLQQQLTHNNQALPQVEVTEVVEKKNDLTSSADDSDPSLGYEQRYFSKYNTALTEQDAGQANFGNVFPVSPSKGDVFLRTDYLPNRLYKWNNNKWIEIDKDANDRVTYNVEYIQHLIHKIQTGQYDIDDVSATERTQIELYIKNNDSTIL